MKNKLMIGLVMLTGLLILTMVRPVTAQTQPSTPTPMPTTINPTPNAETATSELERRVFQLETTELQQIEALKESNERYKFLLTGLGALLSAIVLAGGIFQAVVTRTQLSRETAQDIRQAEREKEQDQVQYRGAQQVSDIMNVVKNTLQERLDAELQAREEAQKSREQLDTLREEVKSIDKFFQRFQKNIQKARQAIEEDASRLALTPRHEFKPITNTLINFARQFDTFNTEYEELEAETQQQFSSKADYIRGIAAHYSNQPENTKKHLLKVTAELQQPEAGDTDKAYKRRLANAYYYLGITDSNFGNTQAAIDSFEQANSLDPDGTDFLTKVVSAESYVMSGIDEFNKARQIIDEIKQGLHKKRDREGRLAGVYLKLQSRASLIQANMAILKHDEGWLQEVEEILLPIRYEDPGYYYGTATLAQVYALQDEKHDDALRLFQDAYDSIERSGDLLITTEARSQILMRMVAGLCCRHGLIDEKRSDDHLDKADGLRSILPKIDSQTCTVFSTFSKVNERSETIHDHIESIRKGDILLDRITRANKKIS